MIAPLMPVYNRVEVRPDRGEGPYMFDTDGKRYLDFTAGIGVLALGHCHPHLVDTLKAQAERIWHSSNIFPIEPGERLAERLVAATFADTVFFTNSGAEAVECAIKTARKYHFEGGRPERWRVITMEGAFHGRTLTAIAAAGSEKMLHGFGPPVPGFDPVAFDDLDAVKTAITDETAAIMVEPIQGEGGIRALSPETLKGLRQICDDHGLLLILDEIQCGMGRTGDLFVHESVGITPDIMPVAKAIGGGFPLGACLATADAARGMTPGTHGSTYGGNFLAAAVGNAVLDIVLQDDFLAHVREVGAYLGTALENLVARHPNFYTGVRGTGLMRGLVCGPENKEVNAALRQAGLLVVNAAGNVLRLLPPLIIEKTHVDEAVDILDSVAAETAPASA